MLLSAVFWLALFVGVPLYWVVPMRSRDAVLGGLSWLVVASAAPGVAVALGAWTLGFFALQERASGGRGAVAVFVVGLLGALFAFKYAPVLGVLPTLAIPLGLSFFTFKLLHYGIERWRGNLPAHGAAALFAWVFLFPAFTAGPIERFDHFLAVREERLSREAVAEGLTRIAHGLIKRMLIGEVALRWLLKSRTTDQLLSRIDGVGPAELWQYAILSFLLLYMDFSGYSDIALGASRLFGVRLAENFHWPILARTPAEFWRRWHISLSSWCQNYVYLPTMLRFRSPYLAAILTFSVMGLWHAGSSLWLAWGLWHALGVILSTLWLRFLRARRLMQLARGSASFVTIPLTFAWVCAGHLLTTVHGVGTLRDGLALLGRLVGL